MPKITSTNQLTQYTLKVFRQAGYHAWRSNNGAVFDVQRGAYRKDPTKMLGISDILGFQLTTGRILAVEIKVGKDRLSKEQEEFLLKVNAAGGLALVVKHGDDLASYLPQA